MLNTHLPPVSCGDIGALTALVDWTREHEGYSFKLECDRGIFTCEVLFETRRAGFAMGKTIHGATDGALQAAKLFGEP